jgi:hypothetical protein
VPEGKDIFRMRHFRFRIRASCHNYHKVLPSIQHAGGWWKLTKVVRGDETMWYSNGMITGSDSNQGWVRLSSRRVVVRRPYLV